MEEKSVIKRTTKQPERYGTGVLNFSSDSDQCDDNSFDDKNYTPHKDNAKNYDELSESSESLKTINFDNDFENIDLAQSNGDQVQADQKSEQQQQQQHTIEQTNVVQLNTQSPFELKVLDRLDALSQLSKEILARYAVIEDSLLKNGMLSTIKKKLNPLNQHDEFNSFAKANAMPFKTIIAFRSFEVSLNDEAMMHTAVSI